MSTPVMHHHNPANHRAHQVYMWIYRRSQTIILFNTFFWMTVISYSLPREPDLVIDVTAHFWIITFIITCTFAKVEQSVKGLHEDIIQGTLSRNAKTLKLKYYLVNEASIYQEIIERDKHEFYEYLQSPQSKLYKGLHQLWFHNPSRLRIALNTLKRDDTYRYKKMNKKSRSNSEKVSSWCFKSSFTILLFGAFLITASILYYLYSMELLSLWKAEIIAGFLAISSTGLARIIASSENHVRYVEYNYDLTFVDLLADLHEDLRLMDRFHNDVIYDYTDWIIKQMEINSVPKTTTKQRDSASSKTLKN